MSRGEELTDEELFNHHDETNANDHDHQQDWYHHGCDGDCGFVFLFNYNTETTQIRLRARGPRGLLL